MKNVDFTEFRKHASDFLDAVEEGETVRIFRHGKAVAEMLPASEEKRGLSWQKNGLRLSVRGLSLSDTILKERKKSS